MDGQILGNRYELLEKIGGGGMALVYKAKCQLLNRHVAVKILRSEFINDEEFIKRFRIEAQAAASLSHPNIVSIYDVGSDKDVHYIVMEYVDGVTLKDYVADKGVLDWKEAVGITIQICNALENAHRNNIVHRDIKPHNILMTKDGVVKVTDFGIARAVSSSTMTMVGSTIGSVHYFSPEQARGGYTDEKSDLYSIGIALYEMVTGRLPFDGETPVAVALKHLQDNAVPPIEINPQIPQSINDIIIKAIKKEQNKRYQTASEMLADLKKVLVSPSMKIIEESSENSPTRRMPVINKSDYTLKDEDDMAKKGDNKRIKTILTVSGISLAVLVIFGIIASLIIGGAMKKKEFTVQDYKGQKVSTVQAELIKNKIEVQITPVASDKVQKDMVISQNPGPGRTLIIGGYESAVILEVSTGPEMVQVVDVKGNEYKEAQKKLQDKGFKVVIAEENHEDIPKDSITRTDPEPGKNVVLGSEVTIYKSLGPKIKTVTVPNLIGKNFNDAQKLIADFGLSIGNITPDESNRVDKIISQDPKPDTSVNEKTPVNITFEQPVATPEPKRSIVRKTITLDDPDKYKNNDKIKVFIKSLPTDTKVSETIFDSDVKKGDFPLKIQVPVPKNGSTVVTVFLNGAFSDEFKVP